MKLNAFLKEHGLKIEHIEKDESAYILIRQADKKTISPKNSSRDGVIFWMQNNTNEIFFKLYNED